MTFVDYVHDGLTESIKMSTKSNLKSKMTSKCHVSSEQQSKTNVWEVETKEIWIFFLLKMAQRY